MSVAFDVANDDRRWQSVLALCGQDPDEPVLPLDSLREENERPMEI